jgi:two-component system LytT family response regulator
MKALIIEDEVPAAKHLRHILSAQGGIEVLGVLESIAETVEWFGKNDSPEIVFMDIHLADGLAFEIFQHILITCPIVFTTAYDEYALKAFKVNSVDYLLKPIEATDVQEALKKLQTLSGRGILQDALKNILAEIRKEPKYKTHFLIPSRGDKLIPVRIESLACLFIDAGIVKAMTLEGTYYPIEYTLDELGSMLDPQVFFRANRQFLISRIAIKDVDFWFNSRLSVNLLVTVPEKILISKARITEFKQWFGA